MVSTLVRKVQRLRLRLRLAYLRELQRGYRADLDDMLATANGISLMLTKLRGEINRLQRELTGQENP